MRSYSEGKSPNRIAEYAEYTIAFNGKTEKDETVILVIDRCPDGCMPLWVKNKIFEKPFAWWHISTYVTDKDNYTWGRYNPQEKGGKVNFDWVLPATEENRQKIITEVSRLAFGE